MYWVYVAVKIPIHRMDDYYSFNDFSVLSIIIVQKAIKDVKNNSGSSDYEILSAEQINGITSEFLLAYVLPLFAFDFTTWIGVVEFLVYF